MPDKRAHIIYSGGVQGVGFRITAVRTAESFGIKGWVKNLSDGRVESVCEGGREQVEQFIGKIASVFKRYITDAEIEWSDASGEFDSFEIHYGQYR